MRLGIAYREQRKNYLKQYCPMVYDRLLLVRKLDAHLWKIDNLITELMNNFRLAVKEAVLREIVYQR